MRASRIRVPEHIRRTSQERGKTRSSSRRKDLIFLQEATFRATPAELEELLLSDDLEVPVSADLVEEDELNDFQDGDFELQDDDDIPREQEAFRPGLAVPVFPGKDLVCVEEPTIALSGVYPFIVSPGNQGELTCHAEIPRWLYQPVRKTVQPYVTLLRDFLLSLAQWLETEKQMFLRHPSPEAFVKGEACRPGTCVVLQEGMIEAINARLTGSSVMTKSSFSRLVNKIWLFWPSFNMPLSLIFSEPYQQQFLEAWVIEGCLEQYRLTPDDSFRRGLQYDFTKDEIDALAEHYERLDPEQRLHLLCRSAQQVKQIRTIHHKIVERIADEQETR